MRRSEHIEARAGAGRYRGGIARHAIAWCRDLGPDISQGVARRRSLGCAEKLEDAAELRGTIRTSGHLKLAQAHAQCGERKPLLLLELLRQRILRIFSPCEPDLPDLQLVKGRLGLHKPRQMIPVL